MRAGMPRQYFFKALIAIGAAEIPRVSIPAKP
jgi:hypothetical protein